MRGHERATRSVAPLFLQRPSGWPTPQRPSARRAAPRCAHVTPPHSAGGRGAPRPLDSPRSVASWQGAALGSPAPELGGLPGTAPASPRGPRATCGRHTHGRLAEPVEVHAQVRFDAVHSAGQSDASQEQGEQHHVGHGGRDPHDLGRGRRHGLPGRPGPGPGPGREVTLTAGAEGGVASGNPHTPNGHRTPAQQMPAGARRSALCDSGGLDQDRRFGRDVTFLLPFGLSQQA